MAMDQPLGERLGAYVDLLRRWNAKLNLTRLDRDDAGLARLVIEPLAAVPYLPRQGTLVDIGSGGGSPAIPLKLAAPGLALRMVEAKTRKAAFLREAVRHLGLDRTEVLAERYEDLLSRRDLQNGHGALAVRGVHLDAEALRGLETLVAPGGALLLFGGPEPADGWTGASPTLTLEEEVSLRGTPGGRLVVLRRSVAVPEESNVPRGTLEPSALPTPVGGTAGATPSAEPRSPSGAGAAPGARRAGR